MEPRVALLGALLLAGLGISAWVFAPALQGDQAARRDVGTVRLSFGMIVAVLTLNAVLTLPLVGELRDQDSFSLETFALAALATQVPMLFVVFARLIWPRAVTWGEVGLRPLPLGRIVGVGVTVGMLGFLLTVLVGLLLSQFGLRSNQSEQFGFVRSGGLVGLGVVLLLGSVTAPFAEEIFFRGALFGLLQRHYPLWLAYALSSGLFAAAHLAPMRMNPSQMAGLAVGIFVLGMLLAWTYQRTGSLWPSMVAHGFNNATSLVLLYSFSQLGLQ